VIGKSAFLLWLCLIVLRPALAHDEAGGLPPHYVVKNHCLPGRGFVAVAQAPGYPSTYPMMALVVFKGEIVGFLLEVAEKDGWKPWYNQPEGKPVSHDGGPKHYTQTVMIKKGPSAEECTAAKGH